MVIEDASGAAEGSEVDGSARGGEELCEVGECSSGMWKDGGGDGQVED